LRCQPSGTAINERIHSCNNVTIVFRQRWQFLRIPTMVAETLNLLGSVATAAEEVLGPV
jgi:hypothetical protein